MRKIVWISLLMTLLCLTVWSQKQSIVLDTTMFESHQRLFLAPLEGWTAILTKFHLQGLKKFSNWPTFPQVKLHCVQVFKPQDTVVSAQCSMYLPQVYVAGELVGGLDIIKELLEAKELVATLKGEA